MLVPIRKKGGSKQHNSPHHEEEDGENTIAPDGLIDDIGGKAFDGWEAKYRIPCQQCTIKNHQKKSVFVLVEVEHLKQEREIIFDTLEEAQEFVTLLEKERKLEETRGEARLQAALGDIKLPPSESITLLIEIVSGWDLPIGDFTTSDPYVMCMLGRKEVHRTKPILSTLDPIWTLKTGSLFLLTLESKDLFLNDGLGFLVRDFDRLGSDESLGFVRVSPGTLYKAQGERLEFKLQPPPGSKHAAEGVPGYLAIRCRRASENDIKFMEGFKASLKAVAAQEHPATVTSNIRSIVTRNEKVEKDGTRKVRQDFTATL